MTKEIAFSSKFEAALSLAQEVRAFQVVTAQDHAALDAKLAQIRAFEAELEDSYKAHPLYVQFKALQAQKADMALTLETARKEGKKCLLDWENEQEKARQEQEAKLAAELLAQQQEANSPDPVFVPTVIVPKTAPSTRAQVRWDYKIENPNALPRQFLRPDEVAIRRVVTALKGATNIPGISVFSRRV